MNFGDNRNRSTNQLKLNKFESKKNRLKRNSQFLNDSASLLDSSLNSSASLNKRIKIEFENQVNQYEFSLNLYAIPPFGQIDLKEAQKAVEERLKVLNVLEDISKDKTIKDRAQYFEELNARFKLLGDVFINEVSGGKENSKVQTARRRDHVSHFLLRLLCCQNDVLKRFFIQREVELLKFRLENEKNYLDLVKFLTYSNLNFEELNSKEKQILIKQNKINFNNPKTISSNVFYKIKFEEALELVRTRRVYMLDGYCYCSSSEMVTIIGSKFRLELSRSLVNLYNSLPYIDENKRLLPIFEAIYNNLITKKSFKQINDGNKEHITPDMIDELSVTSFPPCMRNIHELLKLNHHLKHYGRLHYGLFLKGIGLSLEDALNFFRDEFIQNITPEKFQKEYSYSIRYNYGKEGKRTNFSAYSCAKIQNDNQPGTGDSHGCPFKHFDKNNLIKMLKRHSIAESNISEMVNLVQQRKYTDACSNYFSCKNKNIKLEITHPNLYYRESRKIANNVYLTKDANFKNYDENEKEDEDKNLDLNDLELEEDIEKEFEKDKDLDIEKDKNLDVEKNMNIDIEKDKNLEDKLTC